jgi:uncharacterized Zn-binding protein involved in type VI secretion
MPGYILHTGATIMCAHGGQAMPTMTCPRVKVSGQPVAVQAAPYTIAGCAFPPPPVANGPCVTAQFVSAAVRVKAMGMPVLLQDSQAVCVPTGTPLIVAVTQMRARGT